VPKSRLDWCELKVAMRKKVGYGNDEDELSTICAHDSAVAWATESKVFTASYHKMRLVGVRRPLETTNLFCIRRGSKGRHQVRRPEKKLLVFVDKSSACGASDDDLRPCASSLFHSSLLIASA
jgi:hypothetical protein